MDIRINNDSYINTFINKKISRNKDLIRYTTKHEITRENSSTELVAKYNKYKTQILGLNEAIDNSEKTREKTQRAEFELNEILKVLNTMREIAAKNSLNGFEDEKLMKDFDQQVETSLQTLDKIEEMKIPGEEYLGKAYRNNIITSYENVSDINGARRVNLSEGIHSIEVTGLVPQSQYLTNLKLGLSNPTTMVGLSYGDHNIEVTQSSSSAIYEGSRINFSSPVTITSENDRFKFSVDGSDDMVVTIACGSYTNIQDLVAEVACAIQESLISYHISTAEIDVHKGQNSNIVLETADEGSRAMITISDTGLPDSALRALRFIPDTKIGGDAIVMLDGHENVIVDVDDSKATTTTLVDSKGGGGLFEVDIARNAVNIGKSILRIIPPKFVVTLDDGPGRVFEAKKWDTISNGEESIQLRFGEDVSEGMNTVVVNEIGTGEQEDDSLNKSIDSIETAIKIISEKKIALEHLRLKTIEPNLNVLMGAAKNLDNADKIIADSNELISKTRNTVNILFDNIENLKTYKQNMVLEKIISLFS